MKYLLLGAGLQGTAIAFDLLQQAPDTTSLVVVDSRADALDHLATRFDDRRLRCVQGDVSDGAFLAPLVAAADCMISAVNYWYNVDLAQAAVAGGAHFVDLGGNNDVVAQELNLDAAARAAGVSVVPDCGLAPGLANILGYWVASQLTTCETVRLRVGGLPQQPRPPLNYQLAFSVQGLINEYLEPALVIRDGKVRTVPSLTELETIAFPPPFGELEAFQTSGGTSTLPHTLEGRVQQLDYKTIRYRGHCDQLRTLHSLGLFGNDPVMVAGAEVKPRDVLAEMLTRTLPTSGDDVVLILVEAEGTVAAGGNLPPQPIRRSVRIIDRNDVRTRLSAMMRMTGFPAAIIAQMLARGDIAAPGARPQELIVPAERMLDELKRRGVQVESWQSEPRKA